MRKISQQLASKIFLVLLLASQSRATNEEAVFTISHFSNMPTAFLFGSSELLELPSESITLPTMRFTSELIEGFAHPGYLSSYKLTSDIQGVKATFSESCPFPLLLFSKYVSFDVAKIAGNKLVFRADGIGIREVEKKIKDFYSGGVFSAAPQDYKKISARFHKQSASFAPQIDNRNAIVVLYCPFLRDGYDIFDYTLQFIQRDSHIQTVASFDDQGDGFFVYLQTLFVPFQGSTQVTFPVEQFNGTISVNSSFPGIVETNFTYYVRDQWGRSFHSDDLFINPYQLNDVEDATLTFKNSGTESVYIHVRMTGKAVFRQYGGSRASSTVERSAWRGLLVFFILILFLTLVVILVIMARTAFISDDKDQPENADTSQSSISFGEIVVNTEKTDLSESQTDFNYRHQTRLETIPVMRSRLDTTDGQMMSDAEIMNTSESRHMLDSPVRLKPYQ